MIHSTVYSNKIFKQSQKLSAFGGGGGSPHDLLCPEGHYVTKIFGGAGKYVDRVGVICSNGSTIGPVGGEGGDGYQVGETVPGRGFKAVQFRSGNFVDKIKFFEHNGNYITEVGRDGGTLGDKQSCEDKIMGLHVRSGQLIDQAGLYCGKLQ